MRNLFLILLVIVAIEFNLFWNGVDHEPNWAKVWDNNGNEIEIQEERQKLENGWDWNLYDSEGNLTTFLNFWVE